MATIKLYDERDPIVAGTAAFNALLDNEDREILVDRESLAHAFRDAVAPLAAEWENLADILAAAVRSDDTVLATQATDARRAASEAQHLAHLVLHELWDASPGIGNSSTRRWRDGSRVHASPGRPRPGVRRASRRGRSPSAHGRGGS